MSRIGRAPINLPAGVQVTVTSGNLVIVKGPRGELSEQVHPDIMVKVEENLIRIERPTEQKRHKSMHGLYRTLIANMVEGVSAGFKSRQEVVGVGYKISVQGQDLDLAIGYSHDIIFELPPEVKVNTETQKGKSPVIALESNDKQLLGQVSAKIRGFRKPEPYKGKGIKYEKELLRRKAGKTASAK
jgi:large subunit ribosomal protein L6